VCLFKRLTFVIESSSEHCQLCPKLNLIQIRTRKFTTLNMNKLICYAFIEACNWFSPLIWCSVFLLEFYIVSSSEHFQLCPENFGLTGPPRYLCEADSAAARPLLVHHLVLWLCLYCPQKSWYVCS
jgi:hypothetical protein